MQEADIARVLRIERASYAFPWTEGIFRDCLRVNYICRVAEIGVVTVGYRDPERRGRRSASAQPVRRRGYRCRGIGRRLLAHLLLAAGNAGAGEAFLEARPSNTSAIRLYQSLGFTQIGMRRGYYQAADGREDAIVLKRLID